MPKAAPKKAALVAKKPVAKVSKPSANVLKPAPTPTPAPKTAKLVESKKAPAAKKLAGTDKKEKSGLSLSLSGQAPANAAEAQKLLQEKIRELLKLAKEQGYIT
ncbi:MAG: RNA polymerase subunit sigma, partial [Verrucomicrobia bacterium]|nr:RNA polymerase subunit sigma [Verrucomicrobiota bacterium]